MDFKSLQRMAKNVIDKRGGTEALKADAEELKKIATGPGTASDKAKRAADALKDPGARGPDKTADAPVTPPAAGTAGAAVRGAGGAAGRGPAEAAGRARHGAAGHTGPLAGRAASPGAAQRQSIIVRAARTTGPAAAVPRQAWRPRSSMSRFPNSST